MQSGVSFTTNHIELSILHFFSVLRCAAVGFFPCFMTVSKWQLGVISANHRIATLGRLILLALINT